MSTRGRIAFTFRTMRQRHAMYMLLAATAAFLLLVTVLYTLSPQHDLGGATTRFKRNAREATGDLRRKMTGAPQGRPSSSHDRRLIEAERKLHALNTEPLSAHSKPSPSAASHPCNDENPTQCQTWAKQGECSNNPVYMRNSCPVSCGSCGDVAKRAQRCHRTLEQRPLLTAGGVHATFESLLQQLAPTHEVHVLSRPPHGPWIIYIDDFLVEHEIRAMIDKGGHHFERSLAGEGVSPVRTSKTSYSSHGLRSSAPHTSPPVSLLAPPLCSTANRSTPSVERWCNVPFCESDPVIKVCTRPRSGPCCAATVPAAHCPRPVRTAAALGSRGSCRHSERGSQCPTVPPLATPTPTPLSPPHAVVAPPSFEQSIKARVANVTGVPLTNSEHVQVLICHIHAACTQHVRALICIHGRMRHTCMYRSSITSQVTSTGSTTTKSALSE